MHVMISPAPYAPPPQTVLTQAEADCGQSCVDEVSVEPSFIEDVLECFLVNSSCQLFQSVVTKSRGEGLGKH